MKYWHLLSRAQRGHMARHLCAARPEDVCPSYQPELAPRLSSPPNSNGESSRVKNHRQWSFPVPYAIFGSMNLVELRPWYHQANTSSPKQQFLRYLQRHGRHIRSSPSQLSLTLLSIYLFIVKDSFYGSLSFNSDEICATHALSLPKTGMHST